MHAFFNLKEKFPQILFVLVNFLVALYLICFHFHPATLDLSGHISSAKYFQSFLSSFARFMYYNYILFYTQEFCSSWSYLCYFDVFLLCVLSCLCFWSH